MAQVTLWPRVEFRTDHYPRIRHEYEGKEYFFYLHRLTAFAQGRLDHPFAEVSYPVADLAADGSTGPARLEPDARDVHHKNADAWASLPPQNLEALSRADHEKAEAHVANLD